MNEQEPLHKRIEMCIEAAAKRTGNALRSSYSLWGLAALSFIESALVIPIITDPFLVAYILANRTRAFVAVLVTTVTSVIGGIVAYVLAVAFYEFIAAYYLVGQNADVFFSIIHAFKDNTFVLTLVGALTPIPYTIVALVIGFSKGSLVLFILASMIGRGARYAVIGFFTYRFGEDALRFAQKRILLVVGTCALLFLAYVLWRTL